LGAFEVSTVHKGSAILFYSKQISGMWPNANALANRIKLYVDETASMEADELKTKYYTTGRQVRAPRLSESSSTMKIAGAASFERKSPSR